MLPFVALVALVADARPGRAANEAQSTPCTSWTSDYVLAARLRLTDTPHGAGNGVYDVGPGRVRLRFSRGADPSSPARVELLAYEMQEHFTVESSVLFIHAKVTTRTETRATPDANGVAAVGTLRGQEILWTTPVSGYRTDGTLVCEGGGCGTSGVPPKGTSQLHIGPAPVRFDRFVFDSPSLETFHMAPTWVGHTEMPRQTAEVTFSGRRTTRECAEK